MYRLSIVAAFVLALMIATASIGLQASISADAHQTDVEYAFTVKDLSALLFGAE